MSASSSDANDAQNATEPGSVPRRGRLLGVDFGTKRLGLALSNPEQTMSTPLETLTRRDAMQDARRLVQHVRDYCVVGLVVGLPVHMSGDEGDKAREARAFGSWAAKVTSLPVCYADERYSTAQADEQLREAGLSPSRRKERRDMLAAQILLQSYLESARDNAPPAAL
jgi:putative holliday junction resolvase